MIVKYNCKFCGKLGSVEIEDNSQTMFCVEKWAKILCCNRCGDYKVARRKIADAIKKGCICLLQTRMNPKADVIAFESQIRPKLENLAKQFTGLACRHYKTEFDYNSHFTDELMQQPEKHLSVMVVLESSIRRGKQFARPVHAP